MEFGTIFFWIHWLKGIILNFWFNYFGNYIDLQYHNLLGVTDSILVFSKLLKLLFLPQLTNNILDILEILFCLF